MNRWIPHKVKKGTCFHFITVEETDGLPERWQDGNMWFLCECWYCKFFHWKVEKLLKKLERWWFKKHTAIVEPEIKKWEKEKTGQ